MLHADPSDKATELAELERAAAATLRVVVKPATGKCWACEYPLPSGYFCDAECRSFYEADQRAARINGRKPRA
jgi:hypothetical protein